MTTLHGNILTPSGWLYGEIGFEQHIHTLLGAAQSPAFNSDAYILPGFIDLHVHGAAGRDVMEGGDALHGITRCLAQFGTTSMLATTMTAPPSDILRALHGVASSMQQRPSGGASVLGVHLEGPYLSPLKLGAQPDFAVAGKLAEIEAYAAIAAIRVLTLAPEIQDHLELIRQLHAANIRVQLGHSGASYAMALMALEAGASGFTHLFNAMTGLHHREPGLVGAALAHAEFAEIIPDLIHVHPGAILAALRAIPQLYCVSDATAATGMPDGEYQLGRQNVYKCLGAVRLADGTLAGSTLTLDVALRNLVDIGLSLEDASQRLSRNPANYLKLADRGSLANGYLADIVVLDRQLQIQAVYVQGEAVALTNSAGN